MKEGLQNCYGQDPGHAACFLHTARLDRHFMSHLIHPGAPDQKLTVNEAANSVPTSYLL